MFFTRSFVGFCKINVCYNNKQFSMFSHVFSIILCPFYTIFLVKNYVPWNGWKIKDFSFFYTLILYIVVFELCQIRGNSFDCSNKNRIICTSIYIYIYGCNTLLKWNCLCCIFFGCEKVSRFIKSIEVNKNIFYNNIFMLTCLQLVFCFISISYIINQNYFNHMVLENNVTINKTRCYTNGMLINIK